MPEDWSPLPGPFPAGGESQVFSAGAEEAVIRDYESDAQNRVNFLLSWIRPGMVVVLAGAGLVGVAHLVLPPDIHWLDETQRWITWLLLGGGGYALRGFISGEKDSSTDDSSP